MNRGGEPAKIALGLLKLTVPVGLVYCVVGLHAEDHGHHGNHGGDRQHGLEYP